MPSVPAKKQKLSASSSSSVPAKKQKTTSSSSKPAAPPSAGSASGSDDDDSADDSDSASSSSSYHSDRHSDDDNGQYGDHTLVVSRSLSPEAERVQVTALPSRINLPSRVARSVATTSTSAAKPAVQAEASSSAAIIDTPGSAAAASDESSSSTVPPPAPAAPTTFHTLGCSPALISSMGAMSIRKPTPIQQGCIPAILSGRDCIGIAQTGSGKTLAFALPILQRIARDPYGIWAVVLTPTRELAFQLAEQFHILGVPLNITTSVVVGGMDIVTQAQAMCGRPHVIVATPGRLVDLLRSSGGEWGLDRVQTLVLDEADRMLTPTFAPDLAYLFSRMPADRQTCLFTATESDAIRTLEDKEPRAGKEKIFVHKVLTDTTTVSTLKQHYLFIPSHIREPYLYYLLLNPPKSILHLRRPNPNLPKPSTSSSTSGPSRKRDRSGPGSKSSKPAASSTEDEIPPWPPSTIIFTSRCATTAHLHSLLTELLIPSVALHSYLSQKERLASLAAFRSGQVPVLVATDVGSRGLDIPEVAMVVNWDCPREAEDYVHRVGRTARAGRGGVAVTMVTERDTELVGGIEKVIKAELTELVLPEADVLEDLNKVSTAKRVAAMSLHDAGFGEKQKTRAVLEGKRRKRDAARNA